MIPIKFSIKDGVTHFHYHQSDLFRFARRGKKEGDVGVILMKRDGDMLVYRGFGSIENPCTDVFTISVVHCEAYSGKMPTDEERLIPSKPLFSSENIRFTTLDLSKSPLYNRFYNIVNLD